MRIMIVGRQITNCDFLHFAPSYRRNPISTRPFIDKRTISVSEIIDYRRLIEDIDYLMAWQRIPPWCAIIKTARRHKRVGVVAQCKIKIQTDACPSEVGQPNTSAKIVPRLERRQAAG